MYTAVINWNVIYNKYNIFTVCMYMYINVFVFAVEFSVGRSVGSWRTGREPKAAAAGRSVRSETVWAGSTWPGAARVWEAFWLAAALCPRQTPRWVNNHTVTGHIKPCFCDHQPFSWQTCVSWGRCGRCASLTDAVCCWWTRVSCCSCAGRTRAHIWTRCPAAGSSQRSWRRTSVWISGSVGERCSFCSVLDSHVSFTTACF